MIMCSCGFSIHHSCKVLEKSEKLETFTFKTLEMGCEVCGYNR